MYKYIALCVCVCLSGVAADLNKEEGAPCEWDGVRGQCVKETRCFTTLARRGGDHPVCSTKDNVKIVCCTDCHLINDTRNVVMTLSGYAFKDGTKARDNCLEYLKTLPHHCREEGSYSGVSKSYDEQHKCHTVGLWGIGGSPIGGYIPGAKYPHQALLGYGTMLSSAQWTAGGTIVSERFILTAAHCSRSYSYRGGPLTFVALDVKRRSDPPYSWQTNRVKRFIPYPEYKVPSTYHDIALIETETSIIFNKNVLPACLHVEDVNTGTAKALTWRDVTGTDYYKIADTIQTINLEKFTYEECNKTYQTNRRLKNGIDSNTQMCYGSRSQAPEACMGLSGEPLLVSNQFSDCIHTVIGVTSFGVRCGRGYPSYPDVFTRVAYYKTWIESIVWA